MSSRTSFETNVNAGGLRRNAYNTSTVTKLSVLAIILSVIAIICLGYSRNVMNVYGSSAEKDVVKYDSLEDSAPPHGYTSINIDRSVGASRRVFENFKSQNKKSYSSTQEHEKRFQIFHHFRTVTVSDRNEAELNAGGEPCHGITRLADLTPEEFKKYLGYNSSKHRNSITRKLLEDQTEVLRSSSQAATLVDWTGILTTPVKDQGQCGSCWAFSAMEQIETDAIRTLGQPVSTFRLSAQQITSCDTSCYGCDGGWTENAFNYVAKNGIALDSVYGSYVSGKTRLTGTCTYNPATAYVKVKSYTTLNDRTSLTNIETKMSNYITSTGPLAVCIDANGFNSYYGGVMSVCGTSVNHCVQLVGLNSGASTPYWILRNQWNTWWGVNGFIWMKYGVNTCAITTDPIYVSVTLVGGTPVAAPVAVPTQKPTAFPTLGPTARPTTSPTSKPTSRVPTLKPSAVPSTVPVSSAPVPTLEPTLVDWFGSNLVLPTTLPTRAPSYTAAPTANDNFQVTCPAGTFVTGFYGNAGNWITSIGISCANVNVGCAGGGATSGLKTLPTTCAKAATATTSTGSCAGGISSLRLSWGSYVGQILPKCATAAVTPLGLAIGAGSGNAALFNCPVDQVITGISGRAGTALTRIRLTCTPLSALKH